MTVPRIYPKEEAPKGLMDRADLAKLARGRMMVRGSVALNLAHDVQSYILDGRDPCGAQKLYLEALWEKEVYEQFVGHIKTYRHDQDALKAYEGIARGIWGSDRRDDLVREKMKLFEHGESLRGEDLLARSLPTAQSASLQFQQTTQGPQGLQGLQGIDAWLSTSAISFDKPGQQEAAKRCLEAYSRKYGPAR